MAKKYRLKCDTYSYYGSIFPKGTLIRTKENDPGVYYTQNNSTFGADYVESTPEIFEPVEENILKDVFDTEGQIVKINIEEDIVTNLLSREAIDNDEFLAEKFNELAEAVNKLIEMK